jgi:hypothetical protein
MGAPGEMAAAQMQVPCPADPYPLPPPPQCFGENAYAQADPSAPPPMVEPAPVAPIEEQRRQGWGSMDPVPNPGADPAREARAYAEATGTTGRSVEEAERQAYADASAAPIPAPIPAPEPFRTEAPVAEGVPASANPPVVVTMEPIPNPVGSSGSGPTRPRTERRSAEQGLAGAPTRPAASPERRERAAPARAAASSTPSVGAVRRPVERAAAPAAPRSQAAPAARSGQQAAASRPAQRPASERPAPAAKPATRAAGLEQLRAALSDLVRRDLTFTAPSRIVPGQTETVSLTLPAGLAQGLAEEAQRADLRRLASEARIRATLTGEGWRIVPSEPQTATVRSGEQTTFTWQATAQPGARPLSVDLAAELAGGRGPVETLALGTQQQVLEGAQNRAGGGLSPRAIAAGVLLLLALLGVFYFLRRKGDDSVVGSSRARRRRHREPVNLTPYSPGADTPATKEGSTPA